MSAVSVNGSATSHAFTSNVGGGVAATFTYNCPAGTNCLVLIEASNSAAPAFPTAVSYNGVALTMVPSSFDSDAPGDQVSIWYLLNPPTGSLDTVSITYTQAAVGTCGISLIPLSNVNTAAPVGTAAINAAGSEGTSASVTATGAGVNDLYVGCLNEGNTFVITSTGTAQTNLLNFTARGSNQIATDIQTNAGSGFTWTIATSYWWVAAGVAFLAVPVATYNGVNQLDYSVVSGSNSITSTGAAGIGTLVVTAGNLLIAVGQSANIVGAKFSDSSNANSWSSYNPNWAALNGTAGIAGFWCIAQSTGTFTFTLSAAGTCNAMYVWQANLTANNAGGFIQGAGNYQASIGSGANNATSGTIVGNANTNLYQGFCYAPSDTASPSQGSGFSGEVAVWKVFQGGTTAIGKPEDMGSTGSLAATFSTNNPGNPVYTLGAVFSLQALTLLMGQVIL